MFPWSWRCSSTVAGSMLLRRERRPDCRRLQWQLQPAVGSSPRQIEEALPMIFLTRTDHVAATGIIITRCLLGGYSSKVFFSYHAHLPVGIACPLSHARCLNVEIMDNIPGGMSKNAQPCDKVHARWRQLRDALQAVVSGNQHDIFKRRKLEDSPGKTDDGFHGRNMVAAC